MVMSVLKAEDSEKPLLLMGEHDGRVEFCSAQCA